MKIFIAAFLCLIGVKSFASFPTDSDFVADFVTSQNFQQILAQAELTASTEGKNILQTSDEMITNQTIVVGSCWDYVNAVYTRAGYQDNQRVTIFEGKEQGPFVQDDIIQAGDWLYFINHSFGNVEHSAIFIAWTDVANKQALMVSYAGGDQSIPARLKVYDLSNVYNVIRPH